MNKRWEAYCYWRARSYPVIESVEKAGYKAKNRIAASKYGYVLEHKSEIQERVELEKTNLFDKSLITDEFILNQLREIAMKGKIEANRLRALELLGKSRPKPMFTDKHEIAEPIPKAELSDRVARLTGLLSINLDRPLPVVEKPGNNKEEKSKST